MPDLKLEKWLDPELELDPQLSLSLLGLPFFWAKLELEPDLEHELTEAADVESRPHHETELEPES